MNGNVKNNSMFLLSDYCDLMISSVYSSGGSETACYDMFFRTNPDGGFLIFAGLDRLIEILNNFKPDIEDIEYLRRKGFSESLIKYITETEFKCDIWSVPEGTPVFPGEPVVTVKGPAAQAKMLEGIILNTLNYQTLMATRANRIVRAAKGRKVIDRCAPKAHGAEDAVFASRAAYIAGFDGTTCILVNKEQGIPVFAEMSHGWVQMFDSEYEAFKKYAEEYPQMCSFVLDTYDVLKSGVKNAVKVFDEVLKPMGVRPASVRIDSGDLAYLSVKVRKILDDAGYSDCKIHVANDVDEKIIREMILQGAEADAFLVGEKLVNAHLSPEYKAEYKLVAVENDGKSIPKIKISENTSKIAIPGEKMVWRLYDRETGKALADLITFIDDTIDENVPCEIFHPFHTWKKKEIENFVARPLLCKIFSSGKLVYERPSVSEIRRYCSEQVDILWEEVKRLENPHTYYVDIEKKLWQTKDEIINRLHKNLETLQFNK